MLVLVVFGFDAPGAVMVGVVLGGMPVGSLDPLVDLGGVGAVLVGGVGAVLVGGVGAVLVGGVGAVLVGGVGAVLVG
ncbi:MAG TPA: hypothetical protein VNY52_05315, partial [Solirubrobacteraceae bacterium]|nr:hypothetical protein [Solirubrobacteraceae bacterium]